MAENHPQSNSTAALMGRLARESIRPYVGWIAVALACMVLVAAATAASAWLMKPIINDVLVVHWLFSSKQTLPV